MSVNQDEVMQVAALLDENLNESKKSNTTTNTTEKTGTKVENNNHNGDNKKRKTHSRSPSPRVKSERKSKEKKRSRERSSERRDKDKERDKYERRDRSRDRYEKRERSRDRYDRRERSRDRYDRRSRDRYEKRERSRDRYDRRSRDRYDRRSRDRYDRRSRDRYDRRSRERYDRRSRDKYEKRSSERRSRDKYEKKSEEKKESPKKEEIKKDEVERTQSYKDASTIFVSQLPILATAREVVDHFSKVGIVRDVRLIPAEKGSRKSRGFGYVEFDTPEQAMKAVNELIKEKFQGRTLFIQSQVERLITTTQKMTSVVKNTFTNQNNSSNDNHPVTRLYVGGIDKTVTEHDIRESLKNFGEIVSMEFRYEEIEKGKAHALVQFKDPAHAEEAYHGIKDKPINGKMLKFGLHKEQPKQIQQPQQTFHRNLTLVNTGDINKTNPTPFVVQQPNPYTQKTNVLNQNDFNDTGLDKLDDDRGVSLNARSRAILMSKLQRSDDFSNTSKSDHVSPCVILKNVFDPSEEEGEQWPKEIEEDVAQECRKFGNVLHCHVEPNSQGFVYLRFETGDFARNAIKDLNGRWFGKRQISAEIFPLAQFAKKFPDKK